MAGLGQRDRDPAAADRELEDRAAGRAGQREVQVEVARVLEEVEVVQAGERRRGRGSSVGRDAEASASPALPADALAAARLTASALIASRTARLAAIAVVSAWSYGGETSTTSIPASSTAPTIWRMARSTSRVSIPPGSGVPVPGRHARVDDVDVELR